MGVTAARAHLALGELPEAAARVRAVLTTPSPFVDRPLIGGGRRSARPRSPTGRGDEGAAADLLDRALQLAEATSSLPFVQDDPDLSPGCWPGIRALAARWPAAVSAPPEPVAAADTAGGGELPDPFTPRSRPCSG